MATTTPTVITSNGTPVEFLPLPTPFPAASGCSSYIYRQVDGHFLAWDPFYGATLDKNARSCLPPQVTSWWSQTDATTTSTALGPVFVCPQAYSAVQTVLVASETQEVYCCPSEYSLFVVMPNSRSFPSQCISTVNPGETLSFLSLDINASGVTSSTTTVTTIQQSSTATVFGIPVNGFNIGQSSSTTSTTTLSSSDATATNDLDQSNATSGSGSTGIATPGSSSSEGTSTGTIVGATVGAVVAVLAAGVGAFAFWKRRRRQRKSGSLQGSGSVGWMGNTPPQQQQFPGYYSPQHQVQQVGYYSLGVGPKPELSAEPNIYEMPGQIHGLR